MQVALVWACSLAAGSSVYAQSYPARPIRIIAPEPGGGGDLVARVIAQGIGALSSQPVIVENRAGLVAIESVAKAPPDGYTLLVNAAAVWLTPLVRDDAAWDPLKDFAPVVLAVRSPNVLVIHPSLPVRSVQELIAFARARPGALDYASGPAGSATHIAVELFCAMSGARMVRIGYRSVGLAVNAVIGGEVPLMITSAYSLMPHIKSGRLRALGVTSAQPSALVPDLPAVAATLPGYESVINIGLFAPGATSQSVIKWLNEASVRVLRGTETRQKLLSTGGEAVGSTPDQFAAAIKTEMSQLGKVIRDAGIRAE